MQITEISEDFWNIRGSFRIGGVLDIGTHASLIRKQDGRFLMLDSLQLDGRTRQSVMQLTDDGAALDAIINLHPFHTVFCEQAHADFPDARLYGTARHQQRFADLPWEDEPSDDADCHALFEADLAFSVPEGVDLVTDSELVHFASVLALHRSSNTLHVDDTLMAVKPPALARGAGMKTRLRLHPTLAFALQKRPGAADAFEYWTEQLGQDWSEVSTICAAHNDVLHTRNFPLDLRKAVKRMAPILWRHRRKYD
ncbi:MAG: hypothetical protein ACPGZP_03565 [Panacagrimonas sp.]